MKSFFLTFALVLTSTTFAKDNNDGRMLTNDGRTINRIEVGRDNDSGQAEMNKRIAQLERAVRELQNRVYDLEDSIPQTKPVKMYTCETKSTFGNIYVGEAALSEKEARENTRNECEKKDSSLFCAGSMKCESKIVNVRN